MIKRRALSGAVYAVSILRCTRDANRYHIHTYSCVIQYRQKRRDRDLENECGTFESPGNAFWKIPLPFAHGDRQSFALRKEKPVGRGFYGAHGPPS